MTPVDRRIIALAVPALGSLAVEPFYILVDTAIVGRIGTDELAGLAVAASILSLVFAGSNFLTYGTTERIARRLGAGDRAAAAEVGVQTMWLSALVGVIAAVALGVGARTFARAFGASGAVLEHAETYLTISAVGVPFMLLSLGTLGVFRGESDYTTPLWVLLGSNAMNVVVEVILVFGLDLGVAGSAWSTVVSQMAAAVVFMGMLRRRLAAADHRRPSWERMAPLMSAGRHLLLRVGSMLAVNTGSTAVIARVDDPSLAAHQVTISLLNLMALALDALAVPAHTLVAEELGRDNRAAAAHVSRRSVVLSVYSGAVLAAVIAVAAPVLPYVFTPDPAVIERATSAIWWLAALAIPGAIAFAYDGVLIGAGDYRFLGRAALGYTLLVAPFGAAVLRWPSLGIAGAWCGLTVWMLVRAAVNHRRAIALKLT